MAKNRERDAINHVMKVWQAHTGGWWYRIPDSYHFNPEGQRRFSAKRPFDVIVSDEENTYALEFKWQQSSRSFPVKRIADHQWDNACDLFHMNLEHYFVIVSWDAVHWLTASELPEEGSVDLREYEPVSWWQTSLQWSKWMQERKLAK